MDHFGVGNMFMLIAILNLCAAAAVTVIKADKGTYSVINKDDILDKHHTIYNK
jgi:hypothetical protein